MIQILSGNISFLIGLIFNNLFFLFGFAASTYFFFGSKKFLFWFVVIVIYVWASISFADSLGWVLLGGSFLALMYISQLGVGAIAEAIGLRKHLILILEVAFWIFFIWFNFSYVGGI